MRCSPVSIERAVLLAGVRLALCCAASAQAWAAAAAMPSVIHVEQVRHGRSDRLIVLLQSGEAALPHREGDVLVLTLPAAATLSACPPPGAAARSGATKPAPGFGHFMRQIACVPGGARLTLSAGAHVRVRPLRDRLVIDADDDTPALLAGQIVPADLPPSATRSSDMPATQALQVTPMKVTPMKVMPMKAGPPVAAGAAPPAASVGHEIAAARAAQDTGAPGALVKSEPPAAPVAASDASGHAAFAAAAVLPPDETHAEPALLLPMEPGAAAAGFTRGGVLHVVFDAARLPDLAALKDDPLFGGATERALPDGGELRLPVRAGLQPRLSVAPQGGWLLTLSGQPEAAPLPGGHVAPGGLALDAGAPGHVVVVDDEATGERLLVGTQHTAGQRWVASHRAPDFAVLPTWQGVLVLPQADRVALLTRDAGFLLRAADPPALSFAWPTGPSALRPDGQAMTRRFDLPGLPAVALRRRLAEAVRDAATAPRTARLAPRLRVAQAMLACGLDAEAAAVLRVAAADDPAGADTPLARGLAFIATWLSAQAGGAIVAAPAFDPASLGESDEALLWRALWTGAADPQAAAASLAVRWPLLLDYPQGLRGTMLPAVAGLLAQGGQDGALSQFLDAFADHSLDPARAALLIRQGKPAPALALLDRLAGGQDRLLRAQALEAATEQRLASHALTAAQAAETLDRQLYAWRGGDRELRLRLRVAALHAQAGEWRRSLAELRETQTAYPEAAERIHATEIQVVSDLLHGGQVDRMGALDVIALADAASSLLGAADADSALAPALADRLVALDLPAKAEPILRRLMERADGPAKAGIGFSLAGLLADGGDARAALAVLAQTQDPPADPRLADGRTVLRARLLAETGHVAEALTALAASDSAASMQLQATIREGMKDWAGAGKVWTDFAASPAFAAAPAADRRDFILRAVRDAGALHDAAGLARLRARFAALFDGAPGAGLFDVLTAEPVQGAADLPRAGQELAAMRALPASLSTPATHN